MRRATIVLGFAVTALAVVLMMSSEVVGQTYNPYRRSTGNKNPNPPRRSPGNFPPDQPNYYSTYGRQSSNSQGSSSRSTTVVVPNPNYRGWYYPAVPAYPAPVYGGGTVYVPAPGYYYTPRYYPYYYRPGYVVPRYPYAF